MNAFQESIAELKKVGDRLFERLSSLFGTQQINENQIRERSDWKAIISILRSCIRQTPPSDSDLKLLNRAIKAQAFTLTAERRSGAIRIGMWGKLSVIAYHMAYYVNCLAEDTRLGNYQPLGACVRCDAIFMKRRTDQEFCSNRCRSEAWAAEKGKDYFSQKARESRAARKALNVGKVKENSRRKEEKSRELKAQKKKLHPARKPRQY
jgi:hypothetical protein